MGGDLGVRLRVAQWQESGGRAGGRQCQCQCQGSQASNEMSDAAAPYPNILSEAHETGQAQAAR